MSARPSDLNGFLGQLTTWTAVVLVAAVAITAAVVLYPSLAGAASTPAPPPAPAYEPGSRIDTPDDWHAGSPFTLVLFAQASCGACQRAQPFLKALVDEFSGRVPIVMVSASGSPSVDAPYAEALGLDTATVRAAPDQIRAHVTPTLVLVDRTGTVLHAWEGVPPDRQRDVLQAIRQTTAGD